MWKYRDIFIMAFLIAMGFVPFLRQMAFRLKILDYPKKHGIHSRPVPRTGGIALYTAFVIAALYRFDVSQMFKGVLVGASLIFIVGLLDDLFNLRASLKLAVQLMACLIMIFYFRVVLHVFHFFPGNVFFSILGLIGLTNAVNFLDNMDGLSSGLVMIASTAIMLLAVETKQFWLGYLAAALAGAAGGFLIFNLRPAYIFMGDAGSTFLGFTLASLCIMTEWSNHLVVSLTLPVLILGVPILDMVLITLLRFKEKRVRNFQDWINYTGKDHLSHRLARLGLGHRGAVLTLWALQISFCALALWIAPRSSIYGMAGLVFYSLFTLAVIFFFRKKRRLVLYLNGRPRNKKKQYTKTHFA